MGDPVIWEYLLINTGDEPLVDVLVVDDQGVEMVCDTDELEADNEGDCSLELSQPHTILPDPGGQTHL